MRGSSIELLVYLETKQAKIQDRADMLSRALEFLDQCRRDPDARPTGALRDAREGFEACARDLLAAINNPLSKQEW